MSNSKLFLTFFLFLLGAGFVYSSLFEVEATARITEKITALSSPSRSVASEVSIDNRHSDLSVELNCNKPLIQLSSSHRLIQFKGKLCHKPNGRVSVVSSISNLTNRVTASVFQIDSTHFETDIVSLSKGTNEFEFVVNQGSEHSKIKISVDLK